MYINNKMSKQNNFVSKYLLICGGLLGFVIKYASMTEDTE